MSLENAYSARIAPMTRRHLLLSGFLATVAGVGVAAGLLWPRPSAITRENAARIKRGMSVAEVESILAGPERDETGGAGWVDYGNTRFLMFATQQRSDKWVGSEVGVWVRYYDDRVWLLDVGKTHWPQESTPEKIRRWLRP
jgi:hypothetical protein